MKERPTDNCPICSSHEEKVTNQVLNFLQKKTFAKNTMIFDQQEDARGLYLVAKGSVKISKVSPAGKEIVLQILGPGKTFGEGSILGQDKNADAATALEASEVFYIPKKDFQTILAESPLLYQSVVTSLVRWMDNLNTVIENINTPSAKDRVWMHICRLGEQQAKPLIKLDGKKHDVALMLGLRPETFSRALAELEEEGLIRMNHKQIQIIERVESN
ncbi:Crp/Fnr family transcriptional regulator [Bdellovibrio sp. ZAP7]|uniref:Crp/Fnr family transcriptional regulator n=1 Tax=Bdellovibrio sp. ZAP7 TaxID=2231053 RepID=UPI001156EC28|nr:Crp/Fnr family transcriptional regulator [Bdellovibrio sp. ZAP7]QDK44842.1 Crp/Fnr family transcriptional regulator [Bdellovibrio sp. ZAP7]